MSEYSRIINTISEYSSIYIYGAGKNARLVSEYLDGKVELAGFVVTSMVGNPTCYMGMPVMEVLKLDAEDSVVLVPFRKFSNAYKSVMNYIVQNKIKNVYFLPDSFFDEIIQEKYNKFLTKKEYKHVSKCTEDGYLIFENKCEAKLGYWMVAESFIDECDVASIAELFPEKSALDEYESQFGEYNDYACGNHAVEDSESSYNIYMATGHRNTSDISVDYDKNHVFPIQVGAALTNIVTEDIRDNTGINISERNYNYSEGTAIYWMWKNAPKSDYIGLYHYRRHMLCMQGMVDRMAQEKTDILVLRPSFVPIGNRDFFMRMLPESDFKIVRDTVANHFSGYLNELDLFFNSRFYIPCNIFLMNYELFIEYAEFVFSITLEVENYYAKRGIIREDRYLGYILECLMNIFLMHKKDDIRIAYTDFKK